MSDRRAEAAQWFARMRGPDADAERPAFETWRADPDNAAAYARAEENWLLVGRIAPDHLAAHREVSAGPANSYSRWALAAALVLALSLGFAWIFLGQRGGEPIVAENATGEVVLEDGTRVALTDGAKLDHRFGPHERHVILTGGRARFTVAHDASRPFRVQAGGSLTTALGTVFEVDLTGPAPIIHLVEGSVEVGATRGPASPIRLRPGQRATVANKGPQLVRSPSREQETVMTSPVAAPVPAKDPESLLIADQLPLGAVIDRANRVNAAQIELADSALAAKPISGTFDVADARSLSRQLSVAFDLDVQESGGRFILRPK